LRQAVICTGFDIVDKPGDYKSLNSHDKDGYFTIQVFSLDLLFQTDMGNRIQGRADYSVARPARWREGALRRTREDLMDNNSPKVTIGLPVYNGDKKGLRQSIESILGQDYSNIELVISDNASTDGTSGVCQEFAAKENRVRYYRNETNIGANKNFLRALDLCTSAFFKWAEHGDVHEPSYISSCMKKMLEDDAIVLCYPRTRAIHENGVSEIANDHVNAMDDSPVERYVHVISELCYCNAFYGIYRTSVVRELKLWDTECRGPDVVMMAEIALKGKILQIDDILYLTHRDNKWSQPIEEQTCRLYRMSDPNRIHRGITFPFCRMIIEHLDMVRFSPLDESEKVYLCEQTLKILGRTYYPRMRDEIKRAVDLIHQRRFDHNWGDPNDGSVRQLDPKKKALYQFYAAEILKRFEEALCVCPQFNEPGIHYARAICLTVMDRFAEAMAALRLELTRFPEFGPARRQLSVLEQVLART
jgi:glycosyltransferase involved in cell wall biosynthesis